MGTRFEQFIRDHRDEFDSEEPGEQVWTKLNEQISPKKKSSPLRLMTLFRWSAAAGILVLAGLGVYSLLLDRGNKPPVAQQQNEVQDSMLKEINPGYAEEVYHFTRLIELKQHELKAIEKEHPRLYKKFVTDITRLDSSYNSLRRELPQNPNREQLLEAMIENLRLQTEILNQQLSIIKTIKESNSNDHENNSKPI